MIEVSGVFGTGLRFSIVRFRESRLCGILARVSNVCVCLNVLFWFCGFVGLGLPVFVWV